MSAPNITTLPDGRVRVETVEANQPVVRHYTALGATIYVIPSEGPRALMMIGSARNPERLREGETLEDAVRRLHAPPPQGNHLARWLGLMLVMAALGGLLAWLQVPFGWGW